MRKNRVKTKVLCISGKSGSGKDESAKMLVKEFAKDGSTCLIIHFADLVKYICATFFGWNGAKDNVGRALLQTVGTDVVRKQKPDFWVSFVYDIITLFDAWDYVVIPDCRFPNEYEYLRDNGLDVSLLRIERPGYSGIASSVQRIHSSEIAMDDYVATYYIQNDGDIAKLHDDVVFVAELVRGSSDEET